LANDVGCAANVAPRRLEYLVAPCRPSLIEVVSGLYLDPGAPDRPRGGRGGRPWRLGSSTLAHNIGWCIAEMHINTTSWTWIAFGTVTWTSTTRPARRLDAPARRSAWMTMVC
jgi:pilus assembly protein CpaE